MNDARPEVVELTDRTLDEVLAATDRLMLIDFYSDWCGPCRNLEPVLEQVAAELTGTVPVFRINIDRAPVAARAFGIQAVPTVLVMRDSLVRERLVGARASADYFEAIERVQRG